MSTDFQQARVALGARLRELRTSVPDGRLTGTALAQRLGWPHSKVYKLENGRQTATAKDLTAWAEATGQPSVADELHSRLRELESRHRSWRRQLSAGHRAVQEVHNAAQANSAVLRAWESSWIVGVLQTPDYARAILTRFSELHRSKRDVEEAVRARMKRQSGLYDSDKRYHVLLWEAVLHTRICPPSVLAGQLDRLLGIVGLDTVELGVVPFGAALKVPPGVGFWIYDDRQVIVETWDAELWLDDTESVTTHLRTWCALRESAVFGPDAQRLISQARRALST
ncbi:MULTISPECIES: helix-turn-helix domain-containing protein [Streptomyces]|uniref:helix-turn-helix domain-containing protein n=1 Tax=Streptomyces TaxID=1883 RepID=UPI00163CFBE4|nr:MULTISPECIES: helix-turn-helix transcriptional regulator [Streptomyces]MBC2879628.1 helix-turn-helix transcriptional regulator [Streptomyces sp. TYQ1024]UBI38728.1 helix-turn-helix transcriptional regulator [Streptomyces mobaraensis]UKW31308.1 helix-turn-helix transcriptional regulator [Streptomyces sp. TYQ1024]